MITDDLWQFRCHHVNQTICDAVARGEVYTSYETLAAGTGWTIKSGKNAGAPNVQLVKDTVQKIHEIGIGPKGLKTLPFDVGYIKGGWYSTETHKAEVVHGRQIHGHASSRGIHGSVDRGPEILAGLGEDKKDIEEAVTRTKEFDADVVETRPLQLKELEAAEREQRKLESKKQKKRNARKHKHDGSE